MFCAKMVTKLPDLTVQMHVEPINSHDFAFYVASDIKEYCVQQKSLQLLCHAVLVQCNVHPFKVSRKPRKRRPNALQVPPPRRLSWPCVSDLHSMYKAESWQRAATPQ